jgi:hypothetical protein
MTERYLFVLFQHLIRGAQKSIGLVAYKLTPDRNGMVSVGDLMRQPWTFEIYVARRYNFSEKRTRGMHVVISSTDYKLIQYSTDPREGTQARTFASPIDVARQCAASQIMVATNLSMSRDEECKSLNPKESFEQLMRYSELIQQHKRMFEEKLERYLISRKTKLINLLIKKLSKSA